MIKRINLIQKKAFSFTYLMLLQVCLLVVSVIVLLVVYQVYRTGSLEKTLAEEQKVLKVLEAQRDELMKKPSKTKVSVGQYQELFDQIENTPKWSKVLDDMSNRLPNTVWITNLKTDTAAGGAVELDDKKVSKSFRDRDKGKAPQKTADADKSPAPYVPKKHFIDLAGMSADMKNITEFSSVLSSSELFRNITLVQSNKQSFGFEFKIRAEINISAQ